MDEIKPNGQDTLGLSPAEYARRVTKIMFDDGIDILLELHPNPSKDQIRDLALSLGISPAAVAAEISVRTELPEEDEAQEEDRYASAPVPDKAMLYGLVGEVGRIAAQNTETNEYAAAAAFLTFLSANIGRDAYLSVGNTCHHSNLFVLHVGRSGKGRKGDAVALVHHIRREINDETLLGRAHTGGLSSREGLIYLIHDGYMEGKKEVKPVRDKRLWVVESEFSNVLSQGRREGNTLSSALRDCFDGMTIFPAVKRFAISATDPHISLLGAITPSELISSISKKDLTNGFAGRILTLWFERTCLVAIPKAASIDTVKELAKKASKVILFARGDYPMMKDTREVKMSSSAETMYESLYHEVLSKPDSHELFAAMLERKAIILLRISMIFALADMTLVIEPKHIEAALAWVQHWDASLKFIFRNGANPVSPYSYGDELSRKILDWVIKSPEGLSKNGLRDCFHRNVSSSELNDRLLGLERSGLIKSEIIPTKGRSKTVFKAAKNGRRDNFDDV